MTIIVTAIIVLIVLILILFFIRKNGQVGNSPTFQVYFDKKLGNYLVDSRGRALYYYVEDKIGTSNSRPVSNCGKGCLGLWQVFYKDNITISPPLKRSDFSNLEGQQDKQNQTTYKGHPLYYYINDLSKGDAKSEGMNNMWSVLRVD